ncbi:MAG TPA: hypothetical protein VF145_06105, partial [Chitinophagaceae bacterium]
TIVFLNTQLVIFGFLMMAKLVMKEINVRPLTQEPLFWICGGVIIYALTLIPVYGLQNFLVAEHVEIYRISSFLVTVIPTVCLFKQLCIFYGFCLAVRKPIIGIGSGPVTLVIPPTPRVILPIRNFNSGETKEIENERDR